MVMVMVMVMVRVRVSVSVSVEVRARVRPAAKAGFVCRLLSPTSSFSLAETQHS